MRWLPLVASSLAIVTSAMAAPRSAPVAVTPVVDHNLGRAATAAFDFEHVPAPAKDDAAAHAKVELVLGRRDSNGAGLAALTDGLLPIGDDQPDANFFFAAGSYGGRIRIDLLAAAEVAQVNTYSWHSNTRAAQLYNLFASDGSAPAFVAAPDENTDPVTCGWTLVATVDTRRKQGDPGGQDGVSIGVAKQSLGRYRYLLFDIVPTETEDPYGNTFFSEVDVIVKK